jgi:signal transduction histidine kinase
LYERRHFFQVEVPLIASVMVLVFSLFGVAVWVRRRQEHLFGLFGLAALVWGLRNANLWVLHIPMPTVLWSWLAHAGHFVFVILLALFALEYAHLHWPRYRRALWAGLVVLPAAVGASGLAGMLMAQTLITGVAVPVSLLAAGQALWVGWQRRSIEGGVLGLSLLLYIAIQLYDWVILSGFGGYDQPYIAPYSAFGLTLVMAGMLYQRFMQSLAQQEQLNRELEARIAQREAQLSAHFDRMQAVLQDNASAAERQRLVREMHDGLGSQLTSTLYAAERGSLHADHFVGRLRELLTELQHIVHAPSSHSTDLLTVLAELRHRELRHLQQAGIELDWCVDEHVPDDLPTLTPTARLHALRLFQEALANALKHAQARRIVLSVSWRADDPPCLCLQVADDGVGLPPTLPHRRGLQHMQERAHALGGTLTVSNHLPQGTTVCLCVPLPQLSHLANPGHA